MKTIKEVASMLGMTEHTVRYYTNLGLVPSLQRDSNNNRLFDQKSINWLIGVKNLRKSGMSIQAVKNYVDLCLQGNTTLQERYEIILEQKNQLERQMEEVNERYQYITNKVNWYTEIMNNRMPDNSNPGDWEHSEAEEAENVKRVS